MYEFYAQNFEDVVLSRVFRDQEAGFYIDVGAWDPVEYSVTLHFYQRGWRGINVEPIPALHARLVAARPEDVNLNAALGAERGSKLFYECASTALSTFDPDNADRLRVNGETVTEHRVDVRTLADICGEFCRGRTIDFLKIDVEGWEPQVIRGADWRAFRPRVLVIEATKPETDEPAWQDWEADILGADYLFGYFDGLSRFYVRREEAELLRHFERPPGLFDGFSPSELFRCARALEPALAERAQALAVRALAESERDSATAVLADAVARRDAAERERDSAVAQLLATADEGKQLRASCARLESRLNRTLDERVRRLARRGRSWWRRLRDA